ncbi:hypothetical protein YK48G_06540 [Lentilactobacillus fungorum]|uniref:Uncharacterized protein n=1 Tax=Lentilactobacillus fungorum TaxID=2201250 RepID=A0ABQ3VY17_9LACO|nr:hypothetical protein [Lentilactobacillus fungorum]GHP13229.1 hypothetical protein YK48G_06540 [Lentilactobacillus fungorum]
MTSYNQKSLLLNVLNEICERLNIRDSSLIFLNYQFTNEQIRDLYQYLTLKDSLESTVESFELSQELMSIQPELPQEAAETMATELIEAFKTEEKFENVWVKKGAGSKPI